MSFVFYGIETSGLNAAFDQILQLGAIHTDHEFRELERFEIRCRLLPHIVPSPKGILTNGIGVEKLTDPSLPSHYEMVRAIKAKLEAWSPAIFLSHNSMNFGEHFLRQAFYKTLHPPYLTNTNGNCRMDSLAVLRAVDLLEPGTLSIPVNDKGRMIFSLSRLAPANGFALDAMLDATGEAEAVLHLCRLVRERAGGVWSNCVRFAPRAAVLDFVEANDVFALVDFNYGKTDVRIVTAIGSNPEYDAEVFVFDLSHDPEELVTLSDLDLGRRLSGSPGPVRRLRANAGPCILPYEDVPERKRAAACDIATLARRVARIRGDEDFARRLVAVACGTRDKKPSVRHVEEQIYDSFSGPEDQAVMAEFHEAEWSGRPALLLSLDDVRLQVLGVRLLYIEAPEGMPELGLNRYRADLARRLMADEATVPWLTLPQAVRQADQLMTGLNGSDLSFLIGLRNYLDGRIEEVNAFAG